MDSIELRNNFHNLINNIKNDVLLMRFYDIMIRAENTEEGKLMGRLTKEEYEELMLAYKESEDEENLISHEEIKKKHKKWL
ncbi:MAG: hypothetical protein KAT68_18925 [Bacteroidales bacterium]|nr:hypothetical protein [Bacteroidales bacterium]